MKSERSKFQSQTCSVNSINVFASVMVRHTWPSGLHVLYGQVEQNACKLWLLKNVRPCRDTPHPHPKLQSGQRGTLNIRGVWRVEKTESVEASHSGTWCGHKRNQKHKCAHTVIKKMLGVVARNRWSKEGMHS